MNVNVRLDFIYQVMENSVLITMNVSKRVCVLMGFVQTWMDLSNVDAMKVRCYIFHEFQIPKSEFFIVFLGYKLSLSGLSCVDIDDCRENPLICLHGRCRNTVGSYICECESGYLHSSDGGKYSLHLAEIKNYWLFSESLIY